MDFPIEDMIECFLKCERADLVSILELIFDELVQVYEDDTTDSEGEDEDIDIDFDDKVFMSLK